MDNQEYYGKLAELLAAGGSLWQVTVTLTEGSTPAKAGMKMIIPLSEPEFGNLGGGEMEHTIIGFVRAQRPQLPLQQSFVLSETGDQAQSETDIPTSMLCGGRVSVFIEPLGKDKRLYVIGAGHCGKALGRLARQCGYHVTLIDNREEVIANLPRDACDAAVHNDYLHLEEAIRFDPAAHIVIMTHGHLHDFQVLEYCLSRPYRYLGMIGSKNKVAATMAKLRQKGFAPETLERVHAPIGLPIGSQTPTEIAVSIMAELISFNSRQA